ncbi:hypothetical protein LXL04_012836 [Taraxacum kok-saghyz]
MYVKTYEIFKREISNSGGIGNLNMGNEARYNVQTHKANRFRSNRHVVTMMRYIKVEIWKFYIRLMVFLQKINNPMIILHSNQKYQIRLAFRGSIDDNFIKRNPQNLMYKCVLQQPAHKCPLSVFNFHKPD